MYFDSEYGSFKTSFALDKSLASDALTEIYYNEELFYSNGYKLTATNQ